MNSGRNDCQRISRRVVFTGTALALGAAAAATVVSEATAQEKISQADAKYQGAPKDDQRCDGCILFQPPNTCKVVQGEISASGWCQLFVKKT
jgi:High potential iron-sulfur protein